MGIYADPSKFFVDAGKRSCSYRFHPSMPDLVHCRVLVLLGWDLLGLGNISACVPTVALTSMLSPCFGRHLRRGGKEGVLRLVDKPYGNEHLQGCWIIPESAWFRAGNGLQTELSTSHSTGRPRGTFGGGRGGMHGQPALYFSNLNFLPFVAYGAVALNVKFSGACTDRGFGISRFVQYLKYKEIC